MALLSPMQKSCICHKFTGSFQPAGWESTIQLAKRIKKTKLKIFETKGKKILSVVCERGSLNLIIQPQEQLVRGNLFLSGESIKEITELPMWNLFEFIVESYCANASLRFYPDCGSKLTFKEGKLQVALEHIDTFLQKVWVNYLLEQLYIAMQEKDEEKIQNIKEKLIAITNQSLNLSTDS